LKELQGAAFQDRLKSIKQKLEDMIKKGINGLSLELNQNKENEETIVFNCLVNKGGYQDNTNKYTKRIYWLWTN